MDLSWRAMPMRAAKGIQKPCLGTGVYMHVLETTGGSPTPHYIGKAVDLGKRWREHVLDWYVYPHQGYSIPENVDDYLANPVNVINNEEFEKGLPNRGKTMRALLKRAWFCWSEVDTSARLGDLEYVLQEGARLHWGIVANGWIGDVRNRTVPKKPLVIRNRLACYPLRRTLPLRISYDPGTDVQIE